MAPAQAREIFGCFFDVGADHRVPLLGDRVLGRALLVERREHGLGVALCRRQGVHQILRDQALGGEIVEADRVAVALQPEKLAFVGVEVFHPQLRRVRMRCKRADRLDVDAGHDARLRHDDVDRWVALEDVLPAEAVVIPRDDDRGRALRERGGLADDRHEVARLVEVGEELQARRAGIGSGSRATGHARRVDRRDRLVGRARIAGKGDAVLEVGAEKIGPIGRARLDDVLVHDEREHAVVVAVPGAVGVLGRVRDRVPGRDLVGREEAVGLRRGTEGQTDVDDVGRLRAGVALVGLDRLDFVAGAGVGVQFIHLEAVLRLEAVDHRAVSAPVVRQRDRRQRSFLLGGCDEVVHPSAVGNGGGENRQNRYRSHEFLSHPNSPFL
jgi:hypothetical protein